MNQNAGPLVSVCIPTYNDGAFIRQSLQSITNQTYRNLEILIGDDSSTDNTLEIVESFNDPRIVYHRNDRNLGQFDNVNTLIQRACGAYIAIYHSDDIYDPEIVQKEVLFLETHADVGAVFTLDKRIDTHGKLIGKMRLLPEVKPRTALGLADVMAIVLRHRNRVFRTPSFMGRPEIFKHIGLFRSDYDIASDFEMWLRILTLFKIAILDEWLFYYRRGDTQVSHSYQKLRTFEEHFFSIVDHYLNKEGLEKSIDPVTLTEYAFHRCDDETFRAANFIIKGDSCSAYALLRRPFPWRTLMISTTDLHWRKIRVILLRILMRAGLDFGASRALARLLAFTEYRGRI